MLKSMYGGEDDGQKINENDWLRSAVELRRQQEGVDKWR